MQTFSVPYIAPLILAVLFVTSGSACAQEDRQFTMQPVDDATFDLLREVFEYDPTLPLDARTVASEEYEGYYRDKIVFNGILDARVPGYIATPADAEPPYPCVVALHGLSVSKETWWEEDNDHSGLLLTRALLGRGIAVVTVDARYHGERMINNDFENPMGLLWDPDTHNRFRRMLTHSTVDIRRTLDYLATRRDIDMERIGVIGYSMGGIMSFQLAALDDRVKVGVSCVGPPRIPNRLLDPFSAYQFAPRIQGTPFMVLMGRKDDRLYSVEEARKLHDLIHSPVKELRLYDTGHHLPSSYVDDAIGWFSDHL